MSFVLKQVYYTLYLRNLIKLHPKNSLGQPVEGLHTLRMKLTAIQILHKTVHEFIHKDNESLCPFFYIVQFSLRNTLFVKC